MLGEAAELAAWIVLWVLIGAPLAALAIAGVVLVVGHVLGLIGLAGAALMRFLWRRG